MNKLYTLIFFSLIFCAGLASAENLDATVNFDASKLKEETKDGATLFRYEGGDVNYVEHGKGAPVLPCRHIYVVAPKGADYAGCRVKIQREKLPGRYKLYSREAAPEGARGAELYPPNCVEFVRQFDEDGFRLFMFRAYPIVSQPADGTVMRIISCQLMISCKGEARYENVPTDEMIKIKRKVMNPKALETLVASLKVSPRQSMQIERSGFATGKAKGKNVFADSVTKNYRKGEESGDLIQTLKQNNVTIDEGSLIFSPIQF
ncbi:hypothetical protein IKZ40_02990 [bacterium]|nr:hypothetical protein [bacterium]